jgi:tetratricopeptide (TPR) repeat protein
MYTFPVAINATKTGPLTLGPVSWELNVPTGERTFFGRAQQHIRVSGDAVTINVLPVPVTPDVQGFNGAVGNFSLAEFDASPTTVGAGDPITLKVRIAGRGGFDNVVLPTNQPGWNDFKLYQPTAKFDTTDPLQIEGSKYFEQVVTPQNASVKEIPPFQFTFFDPDQQKFRTLTHGPIPITVHAVAATPQPTVISTGAPPPPEEQQTREIVHIKPFLGRAVSDAPPLIKQPWFLALQAVPPLAWLAALIWRRRKDSLANNPRLRRQRQVARVVQEGLADLARLAGSRDYDGFYSTVFRLLQEQLGERLDLPASAITEAALEDLPHHGLDANAIRNLQELFQACNQYRYTPEHTAQEMNSVAAKLKDALAALQQMKARHGHAKAVARSLACLLFLVFTTSLRAQSPAEAFSQGNKLYEQAKYPDAEAAYQKIIDSGTRSVALWFNLGNAAFKAGHIGRAIEAFRRAEILDPHDPDVRANLHFARDQVANFAPALPGGHWTRWVNRLTLDQWAIASSVALALFFFSLLARQLRPNLRQSGWSTPLLLAAASVCLTICLGLAINQRLLQKSAVVIVGETAARRGPLDEAETAFTLHDGSEILIADQNGPWIEVADAADHTGWVPQKDLAFIP